MEDSTTTKRVRDDSDESESPEAKRLRADLLLDILDDIDSGDRNPDLATFMKSFEEEITAPPPPPLPPSAVAESELDQGDSLRSDLGYLLEASDDELGLPPAVPSSSDDGGEGQVTEGEVTGGEPETGGFGQIWWFDDDVPSCDGGLGLGIGGEEESVVIEGGLFDSSDVIYGPSDYSDLSWWPESLPAV